MHAVFAKNVSCIFENFYNPEISVNTFNGVCCTSTYIHENGNSGISMISVFEKGTKTEARLQNGVILSSCGSIQR